MNMFSAGIVWCMEHQDDDFPEEEESGDGERGFAGWHVGEGSVSSNTASWIRSINVENRYNNNIPIHL